VRRIRGPGKVCLVASIAGGGQRAAVVIVGVAACARHCYVRAGQRKRGAVVVKRRTRPRRSVVALRAIGRESLVGRIRRVVVVSLVAAVAGRRQCAGIIVVRVASCASHRHVRASQWVMPVQGVVEQRVVPTGRVMARSAIVRQSKLHVRWIAAVDEVRGVAGIALGRSSREHIIDMACRALQGCVRTCERVTRELQVVKLCAHKIVDGVAGFARGGEVEGHVINDRRQEILLVARVASRR